jgi:hypothetical protein
MTRRRHIKIKPFRCRECTDFSFTKTSQGVKRTCKRCNYSITEIGRDIIITPLKDLKEYKKKYYREKIKKAIA